VAAYAASSTSISVTWTPSTTAGVTYGVFRGTTPNFAPNAGDAVGSTTSPFLVDSNLAPTTTYYYYVIATLGGSLSPDSNEASATTPAEVARINAGAGAEPPYAADEDFSGGKTIYHANPINVSGVASPAPVAVYQSARVGNFTYTIPAPANSQHVIRLHFAETYWSGPGERLFNVTINQAKMLTNYDVYAAAGGKNIAIAPAFTMTASAEGAYVIQFTSVVDQSMISGIEIE
jgi:hypothetical protein